MREDFSEQELIDHLGFDRLCRNRRRRAPRSPRKASRRHDLSDPRTAGARHGGRAARLHRAARRRTQGANDVESVMF